MKKYLLILAAVLMSAMAAATQYVKVTSVDDLASGDVVVMANESAGKVSSALASTSKYITAVSATIANGIATVDGATEITLTASGSNWKLKVGTKTIGNNNTKDLNGEGKGTTTYAISFDAQGNVVIANTVSTNGTFYYNASSPRFACYTSNTMGKVQLYKKVAGSNPILTLASSSLTFDKKALADGTATDQQTLVVTASDLKAQNITAAMKHGTVFSVSPATLASTGGTLTISYTATAEGTFADTVVVTGTTQSDSTIVRECAVSVTIDPTAPTGTNVTYNLLQNLSDLNEGDKVFIGTAAKDYVVGQYVSGSNIKGATASYSADRHQVTASDLNAYTVSISNGQYIFTGSDGKYLYMYNTNKNLSSSETLDNKAKWTITITDDVATIKSVYSSSYQILFNKTASPALFCCYSGLDSNTAAVILYSDHAPAYQEKVLHPAFAVTCGGQAVGDTLDWGEVVYDDSWGTEAAPYSETKSLVVTTTDLTNTIAVSLSGSSAFTTYASTVAAKGGSFSVNFETTQAGTYNGTLTLTYDTIVKVIVLKAKAVREATPDPASEPQITTSKVRVYLNSYYSNEAGQEEMDIFYVSAKNLKKNLYCKWLSSTGFSIPSGSQMQVSVEGYGNLTYGSSANLGKNDIDSAEVTVYVNAFTPGTYTSHLLFYTPNPENTSINDVERRVELVVTVTTDATPDPDPTHDPNVTTDVYNVSVTIDGKVLRNGHVYILRDGKTYSTAGQLVK